MSPIHNAFSRSFLLGAAAALTLGTAAQARPEAAAASAGFAPTPIRGDVNRDCVVNVDDLAKLLGAFGTDAREADFDHSGSVDSFDLHLLLAVWGSTCGTRLVGDVDGSGLVDFADLSRVLGAFGQSTPQADFDRDGVVDSVDLDLLIANWGRTLGRRLLGDVDGNDLVDVRDLVAVLGGWGTATPQLDLDGDGEVGETDRELVVACWGATSRCRSCATCARRRAASRPFLSPLSHSG